MSAPPSSTSSPTTKFAPLRSPAASYSTSASSTAATSSCTEPRQPSASSSSRGSVPRSQTICAWYTEVKETKRTATHEFSVSKFREQNHDNSAHVFALLTCWGLPGGQWPTCKVALASAGFTVGSSVGDSWNLSAPRRTAASLSASVVTCRTQKRGFISLYWSNIGSDLQSAQPLLRTASCTVC